MTMGIFLQGPPIYISELVVELIFGILITCVMLGMFPLLLAMLRKKRIKRKKYRILCYGLNFLMLIVDIILSGGDVGWFAYILWTGVFARWGEKILRSKDLLYDPDSLVMENAPDCAVECRNCGYRSESYFEACPKCSQFAKQYVPMQSQENTIRTIRFCRKCGTELLDGSRFCRKCGTEVNF